jgi:GNAT superfamily N-acetyltransferase
MKTTVKTDSITEELSNAFDYKFDGTTEFNPPKFTLPEDFSIGLIVGPSGSGKTTILNNIGYSEEIKWNAEQAICSHFGSAGEARDKLAAVGLNSVPVWMKPHHVLSNGERFRADLARRLQDGAIIDEFTSVVDRAVAKSCAYAVQRYIRKFGLKKILFATCHYDVAEWLMPDWVFDTATGVMSGRGSERRPEIELELLPSVSDVWALFRNHHYLSGDINKAARCWVAIWEGVPVGFASILAYPSGTVKNAWREHRTVVLPEFQGLGMGVRISDAVGEIVLAEGGRYFSKTANPRMGAYRNASENWRPTSKNMKSRPDYASDRQNKEKNYKNKHTNRICFSHEYIGENKIK